MRIVRDYFNGFNGGSVPSGSGIFAVFNTIAIML
jgi:hypothetical protein